MNSGHALHETARKYKEWGALTHTDWYRATYNLAAGLSAEAVDESTSDDVVEEAWQLCLELLQYMLLLREGQRSSFIPDAVSIPPSLQQGAFLDELRYPAVVLLAGLAFQRQVSGTLYFSLHLITPDETKIDTDAYRDEALWGVVRKLAANEDPPQDVGTDHPLATHYRVLRLLRAPDIEILVLQEQLADDLMPVDDWLVKWVLHDADVSKRELTTGASYNLACLYSLKHDGPRGFKFLDDALSGKPDLVKVARSDRILGYLRTSDKKRWDELVPPAAAVPSVADASQTNPKRSS